MTEKLDENANGVYVIAATPFSENGAIDYDSTDRAIEFYLDEGVHGMTVLGVMGEAPKLSSEEQRDFMVHFLKRVNGRVPVIVGVSNPGIDNLAALSDDAMDAVAAGVMIAGAPGLKTDEQITGYFDKVMSRLEGTPVCLQDYPPTTTVYFSLSVIKQLIADHANLAIFKHEDCPGHRKLSALVDAIKSGGTRRVPILVGNGGLYVPQELARGADGIMTGFAFPGLLVEVFEKYAAGDPKAGEDLFDLYLPLIRHEQQFGFGLALRKETLRRRGIIASAHARQPGPALDDKDVAELEHLFGRLRRKLADAGREMPRGF